MLILVIIFSSAVFIQLVYFIAFVVALKKKDVSENTELPPISVIVCAHDEEENLKELVPQLLAQEYASFEVIVVNDRSNDNTYDYLLEATKRDARLKMVNVNSVPNHVNSKKYAITLGIRAATHDWILLTDADCRPKSSTWIKAVASQCTPQNQFVLGFSPYVEKPGFLNLFIRFESLITALQYLGFAALKNPYMGVGRNLAYRKSLFLEKKGFNNFLHVLGGDDDLFVNQHATGKNTRIVTAPDTVVYSIPETTFKSFFYQKVRHLSVGKKYKAGHKFLLGIFMITWMITWFAGLPLSVMYSYFYFIIIALLIRTSLLIWSTHTIVRKTGLIYPLWIIPILDFLYPIYYLSTGLVALFTKKVRWKT